MNDLREAARRVKVRQQSSNGDALLPFAGFDLDYAQLQDTVGGNVEAAAIAIAEGHNFGTVLRDLFCNGLLCGLMVGQVREARDIASGVKE